MQAGEQSAHWQQFYEGAWAMRAALLQDLIEKGERHPLRLIKRLEAQERRCALDQHGDTFTYVKKPMEAAELLPCGTPAFRTAVVRGNFTLIPFHASTCLYKFIIDFIDEHGPFDAIIELGCGYGRNIFDLWYNGAPREAKYFGGEFTVSGVALAKQLSSFENGLNAQFFQFNHLTPNLSNLPRYSRILVFTVHTIEQVKLIPSSWFSTVASAADEVVCLNFEPFGFQIVDLGKATEAHRQFFLKQDWNQNFAEALFEARDAGTIGLDYVATELFFADPGNGTSLAVWHAPV